MIDRGDALPLARHGKPAICNTGQGSQFTSAAFAGMPQDHAIAIGMEGRGAWRDDVFVERLWRTVKYGEVHLHAHDSVSDARASLGSYPASYNSRRPHSSLGARTPEQAYLDTCRSGWRHDAAAPARCASQPAGHPPIGTETP